MMLSASNRLFIISLAAAFVCVGASPVRAQQSSAIEGIKGVKQEAVQSVKNVQTGTTQPAPAEIHTQGVKKVDGVNTITGLKVPGQTPVAPPPPPPPPAGSAVPAGVGTVGTAATIRAVKGVTGIQALKRENLETALQIKTGGGGTPTGTGAEKGGKGKAAAAALLGGKLETPPLQPGPKEDGRAKLQEVKKLLETGS